MSPKKPITITEYSSFSLREAEGYTCLPEKIFSSLEAFLLQNRSGSSDALDLMTLSARKGIGKVITAQNYVGTIVMNDGTVIEILPKICGNTDSGAARKILVDMLRTLRDTPFRHIQRALLETDRLPLLEIFIRMFTDEVSGIAKRGLQSGYRTVQSNESVVRGKLLFPEHIRRNIVHRERAFVERDEFDVNRPENRLIKSALLLLSRQSTSPRNLAELRTLLNIFTEVDPSSNIQSDFLKCVPDRATRDYETALSWCRLFLNGQGFTSYSGPEIAWALLYPMEVLFESYVAYRLKRFLPPGQFTVSAQDTRYCLFDMPTRQFQLRPDIVVTRESDKKVFILDTKWKRLWKDPPRYGISQADMYQMYVYQKRYGAESVTLIYPEVEQIPADTEIRFTSNDGAVVQARFFHLDPKPGPMEESLRRITAEMF